MRIKSGTLTSTALLVVGLALSGCAAIPSSGPSADAVLNRANAAAMAYTVIEVTPEVARAVTDERNGHLAAIFGDQRKASSSRIGVGDAVVVHIWEAADGGLFSAGMKNGNASIPEQPVSEDGTISVPYVGTVRAAGKTPDQLKALIETALAGKAIEPQVLVDVVKNVNNVVTVTGEVGSSGRIPLSPRGERLMDVIALSGGPKIPAHQLAVQITRANKTLSIPLEQLISDPRENIYVQPDDVVTLIRQPRNFSVFGASERNAQVAFDESKLYLNEALAKVGGLNDERANAKGIFIYRSEPSELIRRLLPGMPIRDDGTGKTQVIYRVDLTQPNGFFLLKDFPVYDGDLVYIANSSLAEMRKFTSLISAVASPTRQTIAVSKSFD